MKKISKSEAHAKNLISSARKISAEYQKMIDLCKNDSSASEKERIEDIALFERKIAEANKFISWWLADIALISEKAEKEKKSAKQSEKASA